MDPRRRRLTANHLHLPPGRVHDTGNFTASDSGSFSTDSQGNTTGTDNYSTTESESDSGSLNDDANASLGVAQGDTETDSLTETAAVGDSLTYGDSGSLTIGPSGATGTDTQTINGTASDSSSDYDAESVNQAGVSTSPLVSNSIIINAGGSDQAGVNDSATTTFSGEGASTTESGSENGSDSNYLDENDGTNDLDQTDGDNGTDTFSDDGGELNVSETMNDNPTSSSTGPTPTDTAFLAAAEDGGHQQAGGGGGNQAGQGGNGGAMQQANVLTVAQALAELKQNGQFNQLWQSIDANTSVAAASVKSDNVGLTTPANGKMVIQVFVNNPEFRQLANNDPARYNQLLKEVVVHELIHAYIYINGPNHPLGLEHDPNPQNSKPTGFGNLGTWMSSRYPAVNQVVINHRRRLMYNKLSLDIGPQAQKFLQSVVPNLPSAGGQP